MKRVTCALTVMLFSSVAAAQSTSQIVARHSGKCLTAADGHPGPGIAAVLSAIPVTQKTCEPSRTTQEWRTAQAMNGGMLIESVSRNECLATENGRLVLQRCNQSANAQMWQLRQTTRGAQLMAMQGRKCINVENAGTGDGVRVEPVDCVERDGQLFDMRAIGNAATQMRAIEPRGTVPATAMPNSTIVGNWRWSNNTTVDFMDNGTLRGSTGQTGRWVREDGQRYVINWAEGWVDRVIMSDDGQHLHGSNQNGGQVTGDRFGAAPVNQPPPPPNNSASQVVREVGAQQANVNDCGAGANDPGCQMERNGSRPLDARQFMSNIETLRRQLNEQLRHNEVTNMFGPRLLTAMQFGVVLEVFSNESLRLEVARERMRNVVDPDHLVAQGNKFRMPTNRIEYDNAVTAMQREARPAQAEPSMHPQQLQQQRPAIMRR